MTSSLTRCFKAFVVSRRFLFLGALCAAVPVMVSLAAAPSQRSYSAGRFALTIDGHNNGFVRNVRGGTIKAEVVKEAEGTENAFKKTIAAITYEPFTLEIGMGMGKGIYDWIEAWSDNRLVRKSGEIVAADFDYRAQTRRQFFNAVITEVTFPALDASSKDPAYLTVKLAPKRIVYKGGESIRTDPADPRGGRAKQFQMSNFRVTIDGLPTERVQKVDSFTLKQVVEEVLGDARSKRLVPAHIEVPNLKVTFSSADLGPWQEWFQSFVLEGRSRDADERHGSIVWLGPDLQEELGRIDLLHVGIVSLEPAAAEANQDAVARFTVELYVEQMRFEHTAN